MATLKAAIIPVTPLQQNSCVIWKESSKIAAVTDPGGDLPSIESFIKEQGLTLSKIFITHGHLDHAGGASELAEKYNVEIEGPHRDDTFLVEALEEQGKRYGMDTAKKLRAQSLVR
jgi:glyoxylase-like metal-dependent hydrolase (beta-lactamase superfamily II)